MAIAKKMTQVTMQVMEALLGSDDLNDAMDEGLELLVNVLESTAGAIWVRDKEEDLYYHTAAVPERTAKHERRIRPMKMMHRIAAIVLAAAMILSLSAAAAETR